jgi:hypothetical protein
MNQPMGPLATVMLDPRSVNSLYQESEWNWLKKGEFPVSAKKIKSIPAL